MERPSLRVRLLGNRYRRLAGNLAWTRDSLGGSPWDEQSAALYGTGSPLTYVARQEPARPSA